MHVMHVTMESVSEFLGCNFLFGVMEADRSPV